MLKIDQNDHVVVDLQSGSFDLSDSTQYREFLLWITIPKKEVTSDENGKECETTTAVDSERDFSIDENASAEEKVILQRYQEFFNSFVEKRNEIIANNTNNEGNEDRIKKIKEVADRLKTGGDANPN